MSKRQDIFFLDVSGSSLGTSGEIPVQIVSPSAEKPNAYATVSVYQITLLRSAGTGVTVQPRLLSATGGSGTLAEAWRLAAPEAVGDLVQVTFSEPGLQLKTDANGKIYLYPGFDAGADNACSARIWFAHGRAVGF